MKEGGEGGKGDEPVIIGAAILAVLFVLLQLYE